MLLLLFQLNLQPAEVVEPETPTTSIWTVTRGSGIAASWSSPASAAQTSWARQSGMADETTWTEQPPAAASTWTRN